MCTSTTHQDANWKLICTNIEPASRDIVHENFTLNFTSTGIKREDCPQIFRGGTLGRIEDMVYNTVRAGRAREEQGGAPRFKVDCHIL